MRFIASLDSACTPTMRTPGRSSLTTAAMPGNQAASADGDEDGSEIARRLTEHFEADGCPDPADDVDVVVHGGIGTAPVFRASSAQEIRRVAVAVADQVDHGAQPPDCGHLDGRSRPAASRCDRRRRGFLAANATP